MTYQEENIYKIRTIAWSLIVSFLIATLVISIIVLSAGIASWGFVSGLLIALGIGYFILCAVQLGAIVGLYGNLDKHSQGSLGQDLLVVSIITTFLCPVLGQVFILYLLGLIKPNCKISNYVLQNHILHDLENNETFKY